MFSQQILLLTSSVAALIISESRAFYPGSVAFKLLASSAFVWQAASACNSYDKDSYDTTILCSLAAGLLGDLCLIPSKERYEGTTIGGDKQVQSAGAEGDTIWFKAGMGAFMLNHLGYMVAFSRRGEMNWMAALIAFTTCVTFAKVMKMPFPSFASSSPATKNQAKKNGRPVVHRRDSGVADLDSPLSPATPNSTLPLIPAPSPIPDLIFPDEMKPLVFIYQVIISCMVACAVGTWKADDVSVRIVAGAAMFMISDLFVAWDVFGKPEEDLRSFSVCRERRGWKSRGIGWVLYFAAQMVIAGTACEV